MNGEMYTKIFFVGPITFAHFIHRFKFSCCLDDTTYIGMSRKLVESNKLCCSSKTFPKRRQTEGQGSCVRSNQEREIICPDH